MRDDLLLYYERELTFLRQMAAGFAERYPKIAARLVIEPDKCEDPHVERLLEGFAFLAARVHLKIDDEFPELTEAILSIVYPQFIQPIPSMSIAEFELDPDKGSLDKGLLVPKGSILYSAPVQGMPCKFRTCYDLTLYPVSISSAEFCTPDRLRPLVKAPDAQYAIPLRFSAPKDVILSQLELDKVQIYLDGEGALIHALYEALVSKTVRILVRNPQDPRQLPVELPLSALRPMGFDKEEGVLEYDGRSFLAYRLMQEFFCFPEKFFFLELSGLHEILSSGFGNEFEVIFLLSRIDQEETRLRLENGVSASVFKTRATPIINLFPHTCEPILMDQKRAEYPIIPDIRRSSGMEIHSITEVVSVNIDQQTTATYEPFYSIRHAQQSRKQNTFYIASRRQSHRPNDEGTDMDLSLVDLSFQSVHPKIDSVTVKTLCTNRDLPSRLPFGNDNGDFELELSGPIKRIIALRKPTSTMRPPIGTNLYWRLISHLSLNYLSLIEGGKEALQQILTLYNFTGTPYAERMISGITSVSSKRKFARLVSDEGIAFARGFEVQIEFDEEQFVGGGVYLFASVLERFLSNYASLNSFTQLNAKTLQRKEALRQWPPRAGQKILI
jgi:type VI secretion system protein ImpG